MGLGHRFVCLFFVLVLGYFFFGGFENVRFFCFVGMLRSILQVGGFNYGKKRINNR